MQNHKIENEIIFFTELFYGCKANCTGCNINKTSEEFVTYTPADLRLINKRVIEYADELGRRDGKTYTPSITLGPADFLSLEVDYIIDVLSFFDKRIRLVLAGNLLNRDYSRTISEIGQYARENGVEIIFQVIFNPFISKRNGDLLRGNISKIKENQGVFDAVLNMSASIYERYTPELLLGLLDEYSIEHLAIVSSPNGLLLDEKQFQTSLVEETQWLENLLVLWFDSEEYGHIDLEVFENRAIFFKDFDLGSSDMSYVYNTIFNHHKKILYIDRNLGIRLSSENIGDYHYIAENDFPPLGNLRSQSIEDVIYSGTEFKKTINRQIVGITNKCGGCEFKLYCMSTPIHWQQEQYSSIKGKEGGGFCYGLKKINEKILSML